MIEFAMYILIGIWVGGFFGGIITGFFEVADNPYPQYKTQPRDFSNCPVVVAFFLWPAMLSEYIIIKLFG